MAADSGIKDAKTEGEGGVRTHFVVMNRPKPSKAALEGPEANIQWVFKAMVPKRGRGRRERPPSIGSMAVPGKP